MMKKWKKPARNSLTTKMVCILILLILPFNLVTILTSIQSIRDARQQTLVSMENMANLSMQQLDTRISFMNDFFYNMENDREAFKIYAKQGERDGELVIAETELARYLESNTSNDASADCIFWHSIPYQRLFVSLDDLGVIRNTVKKELNSWLVQDTKKAYTNWDIIEIGDSKWLLKVYQQGDFYYGGLFLLEEVSKNLRENAAFSTMEIRFGTADEVLDIPQNQLCVTATSKYANLQLQVLVPKREGYASLTRLQLLSLALVFLYVLLVPILLVVIKGLILNPLKRIGNAMMHLRNGEQSYRMPEIQASDEFMGINQTFNQMADNIQTLKIENYEKELDRKRMELKNLQLQIRPHFLMNMFNMLFSFAQIENYQNIQKLALYLSDYFRYIFQSGKELSVFEMEFQLIQKYLEISDMRYPGWCEVTYDIEPEVLEVEVPPLMMHNFVENIFKHVINYEQVIHIRIEAYCTEQEAIFIIADDGVGMEKQVAEQINCGIFEHKDKSRVHVGIENSYRRLRYFYGEKGRLEVESAPGEGCCFTITIPKGEEK